VPYGRSLSGNRAHIGKTAFAADTCDRQCVRGFVTTYLNALVAHNPSALPVAANVKFTEDNVQKKLGEAASLAVLEEGSSPALFTLRLKIADRKISEIETMVVRSQAEGMIFAIDAIQTPSKAMNLEPTPAQRNSREEAIDIATKYPAGLKIGSFVNRTRRSLPIPIDSKMAA
jgi:hypothetical protein